MQVQFGDRTITLAITRERTPNIIDVIARTAAAIACSTRASWVRSTRFAGVESD